MIRNQRILVTGSEGLIGRELCRQLTKLGVSVVKLDIKGKGRDFGDVRSRECILKKVQGVSGIVHLAAISRVIWGEQDPVNCYNTNVLATKKLVQAAISASPRPWVLFSSSREVYGENGTLAIEESAPYNPMSFYGETKVLAEQIILSARELGLNTGVVRFSNVYGSWLDHPDRVIPAFVQAALKGLELRIEGCENSYDFTHLSDTVTGLLLFIEKLSNSELLPPIHFLTEVSTSLLSLGRLVVSVLDSRSKLIEVPSRQFGSGKFQGKNSNALKYLDWRSSVKLSSGIKRLGLEYQSNCAIDQEAAK